MSEAIITVILTQLTSILERQIRRELRLVVGVEKDVKKLENAFRAIQAVLIDAEKRQVKEKAIKLWLENLKDVSYDLDDVLAEWMSAIRKAELQGNESKSTTKKMVCSFFTLPCSSFNEVVVRRDIAQRIKGINERLDSIASEKDRYNFNVSMVNETHERFRTTSYIDVTEVRGRDKDKGAILSKLLSEENSQSCKLQIVSIVGMGGIGKTTTAQLVYNSPEVITRYETRIWVCVSEPFDEVRVGKAIIEDVEGNAPNLFELETILRRLRGCIWGKKFLLVLDDVWTDDYRKWETLKNSLKTGAVGSKVLVTTRNKRVAEMMESTHICDLRQLSDEDSWSLFSLISLSERTLEECQVLERVGRQIAEKCSGLPLAVKTIGSLMRFKDSVQDWQKVLDSELWRLEEAEKGLFPPLLLSYYDLPSTMKRCFSYCAIFPKDHVIEAENLIKLWMAQGYLNSTEGIEMEKIGRDCLQDLAMRSFFQDLEKDKDGKTILRFKLHDMVHDLAQYLTQSESFVMEVESDLIAKMDSSCQNARHITLIRSEDVPFPNNSLASVRKLYTFWVQSFYSSLPIVNVIDRISPESFDSLVRVKALDLSHNRLCELPREIEKLTNLRYLNLSHNPLWELPETLCDLHNLQTLELVGCDHLRKLPSQIEKLANLRHLEIDGTENLKTLPKGISKLGSLRTLSKFIINGIDNKEVTCTLQDLKTLNNLKGCLKIEGLGHITNGNKAEQADLKKKNRLSTLHMDFKPQVLTNGTIDVIEALELHPNMQCLCVSSYGGIKLPKWLLNLTNLRELQLQDCQNCSHLPALGLLPSLEALYIDNMHNLKTLGLEFHGIVSNGIDSMSSNDMISFPKLKKLKMSNMRSLEEWNVTISSNRTVAGEMNLSVMPLLRCLKLSQCSKLKALPPLLLEMAPIKKLRVHDCALLQQQYQKETGENRNKISHIPKVRIS